MTDHLNQNDSPLAEASQWHHWECWAWGWGWRRIETSYWPRRLAPLQQGWTHQRPYSTSPTGTWLRIKSHSNQVPVKFATFNWYIIFTQLEAVISYQFVAWKAWSPLTSTSTGKCSQRRKQTCKSAVSDNILPAELKHCGLLGSQWLPQWHVVHSKNFDQKWTVVININRKYHNVPFFAYSLFFCSSWNHFVLQDCSSIKQ